MPVTLKFTVENPESQFRIVTEDGTIVHFCHEDCPDEKKIGDGEWVQQYTLSDADAEKMAVHVRGGRLEIVEPVTTKKKKDPTAE